MSAPKRDAKTVERLPAWTELSRMRGVEVFSAAKVTAGDLIAYPARLAPKEYRGKADFLRVTRVEGRWIYAKRAYGDDDLEYTVYPMQTEERGVVVYS